MSVKTNVTVPLGSASSLKELPRSLEGRKPELQLDVVRVAEHDHRPDRRVSDRCERDTAGAELGFPRLEVLACGHAEGEMIETGAELVERTVGLAGILAHADDPSGFRVREHAEPHRILVGL